MKVIYKMSVFLLFSCFALSGNSQQQVSFSFQAHQDDWQLFMQSTIMEDLNNGGKVVFVTLTAGDAGNGPGGYGSPSAYFYARERGAVYASQFSADLNGTTPLPFPDSIRVNINGHGIIKYTYKNTVNYFLRLPDGSGNGNGNPITGFTSLAKLNQGTISNLTSVDGVTTYTNWQDLVNTIKNIITIERGADRQVWINKPSLDTALANRGDHSDHLTTSIAATDAVKDSLWVGINEFIDYNSPSYTANLTPAQHAIATGVFAITVWGLLETKYLAPFDEGHKSWLPVDVKTVVRVPSTLATAMAVNGGNLPNIPETLKAPAVENKIIIQTPNRHEAFTNQ